MIADANEDFAVQVQQRMESVLGHAAEITLITDRDYLLEYFESPRQMDILLIDQNLYFRGVERHNIEWIYILTEDPDLRKSEQAAFIDYVYRFSGLKDIVDKALSGLPESVLRSEGRSKNARMILIASPCGGSGKTITALALAGALRKRGKKTLFVDTTSLQQSYYWLRGKKHEKGDDYIQDHFTPSGIKDVIERGAFDFVSPFRQPLPALGIEPDAYTPILQSLLQSTTYDYIVADSSSGFSVLLSQMMTFAHSVMLIGLQDRFSAKKMSAFLQFVDCSDANRFRLLCGMYRPDRKNHLAEERFPVQICEYIPYANLGDEQDLKAISDMECYRRLAAMFV